MDLNDRLYFFDYDRLIARVELAMDSEFPRQNAIKAIDVIRKALEDTEAQILKEDDPKYAPFTKSLLAMSPLYPEGTGPIDKLNDQWQAVNP